MTGTQPDVPVAPDIHEVDGLAGRIRRGRLSKAEREQVARLVEHVGYSLRVALLWPSSPWWGPPRWEPLAQTYMQCVQECKR